MASRLTCSAGKAVAAVTAVVWKRFPLKTHKTGPKIQLNLKSNIFFANVYFSMNKC